MRLDKIYSVPIERGRGLIIIIGIAMGQNHIIVMSHGMGEVLNLKKIHCITMEKEIRTDGIWSAWDLYGQ